MKPHSTLSQDPGNFTTLSRMALILSARFQPPKILAGPRFIFFNRRRSPHPPFPKSPMTTTIDDYQPIEVFFSYAHEDEALRDELAKHLKLLERQNVIANWYDRDITAGQEWNAAIQERLNRAKIILLLISADFLDSDFCWGVELEQAMQRHENQDAYVVPVILREVDWKGAPFGKLQALPKNAEPVMNWPSRDQAFADVARGIRKLAESIQTRSKK